MFVLASVGKSSMDLSAKFCLFNVDRHHLRFTCFGCRDDTGTLHEGIGKSRLSVIDMGNNALFERLAGGQRLPVARGA